MSKKVLMCGNEVIGEAAIRAGCRYYFGYPITPQNELTAYMSRRMPEAGGVFIQSESEIGAISMVLGASAVGGRTMTTSSSPGVSLMQEGISYLAGCELPAVIVNIVRGGPGLGNISPAQSDYFQATKGGGHGDYHIIVLAPSSVEEIVPVTYTAFDLADKYRIPVMVLGDGLLGQMMEPVTFGKYEPEQSFSKDWILDGAKGREGRRIVSLYLGEGNLERHNMRLQKKYREIEKNETRFEEINCGSAEVVIVAYGSSARICKKTIRLAEEEGIKVGIIRPITLWPFPTNKIKKVSKKVKFLLVVELSMGQMVEDVKLAVGSECDVHFYGRTGGGIPTAEEIFNKLKELFK